MDCLARTFSSDFWGRFLQISICCLFGGWLPAFLDEMQCLCADKICNAKKCVQDKMPLASIHFSCPKTFPQIVNRASNSGMFSRSTDYGSSFQPVIIKKGALIRFYYSSPTNKDKVRGAAAVFYSTKPEVSRFLLVSHWCSQLPRDSLRSWRHPLFFFLFAFLCRSNFLLGLFLCTTPLKMNNFIELLAMGHLPCATGCASIPDRQFKIR